MQPGVTYFYVVTAVNSVGESDFSNEANAAMAIAVAPVPTGLVANVVGNQIVLSWNAVTDASEYLLYRGVTTGGESATPITVFGTSYTDSNVVPGGNYFYQLVAVTPAGNSAPTGEVSTQLASALPSNTSVSGKAPASIIAGQAKPFSMTVTFVNASKASVVQTLTTHWFLSTSPTLSRFVDRGFPARFNEEDGATEAERPSGDGLPYLWNSGVDRRGHLLLDRPDH